MRTSEYEAAGSGTFSDARHDVRALLEGYGFSGANCAIAYLSFADPESFVGVYDRDGDLSPLIGFRPIPMNGAALLESIATVDENASRLIANYRKEFPADAEQLATFDADISIKESAALAWLFAVCGLALGLSDSDLHRAQEPSIEAVTLEVKVHRVSESYELDSRYLLRSLMSYRIGGVPTHVLARSIVSSLGSFVADSITAILRDWRATVIVCAGDLFAGNDVLRERAGEPLKHFGIPILFPYNALIPANYGVTTSTQSLGHQPVAVRINPTRGAQPNPMNV
ncbi:MAG: hypothetical protein HKL85_07325 [Acidimicrobiaceae bacterium]|nr:hypothetical protein [Acidimicrobiaceae bacterium]